MSTVPESKTASRVQGIGPEDDQFHSGFEPPGLAEQGPCVPDATAVGAASLLGSLLESALGAAALHVATSLIATFGSLSAVLAARHDQLAVLQGLTEAAIRLIEAAYATQRWAAQEQIRDRELIGDWSALERYLRATMRCRPVETAHGLFLDRKNHLVRGLMLGEGTVDHTPLYPREVVRHALLLDASALILVHNHPSGDPTPSTADIDMTRLIAAALGTVDVALHDHVIVGHNRIASFRAMRHL
jgi:DNA repair protein RadC